MRRALVLCALLLGCGAPSTPATPAAEAPAPASTPPAGTVTPTAVASTAWPSAPGWHDLAVLPGFQRTPRDIAGDRTAPRVAVLDGRGRRVAVVAEGAAPKTLELPLDMDGTSVAWDGGRVAVVDAKRRTIARLHLAGGKPSSEPLNDDRVVLATRPDGVLLRVDQLGRAYKEADPAWRGVPGPGQTMVRATNNDAGPMLLVAEPDGKRGRALLSGIPKARDPRVIGLEPGTDPLVGWMAVWTGAKDARELHLVRFDGQGRVLHTEQARSTPSRSDLRASMLGADRLVLAESTADGLVIRLLVAPEPVAPGP